MTKRQADCLRAIEELTVDGVSPTYEEIGHRLGVTAKSTVHRMIKGLEKRRLLRRHPHCSRALEVVNPSVRATPSRTKGQIADDICGGARLAGIVSEATPDTEALLRSIVLEALQ